MRKDSKGNKLRDNAEEILREQKSEMPPYDDIHELVHKLQTHQIELKMQNQELRRTSGELEEEKLKYYSLYEFAPVGYFFLDENEIIRDVNIAGTVLLGVEKTVLINTAFIRYMNSESRRTFYKHLEKVKSTSIWQSCELVLIKKDENTVYAQLETNLIQNNKKTEFRITITDITERKKAEEKLLRLNRTLKALGQSNKAMTHATDEAEYLEEVCKIIIEDCGYPMVWIGFAENDENKTVRPVAYSGFDEGYLETLSITWADEKRGRGPTGTAIRTGEICACRNMLTDNKFEPWRGEAIKRGYASSLVLPIMNDGKAFGALTIYSREPDPFLEEEINLLEELVGDISFGLLTIRLSDAKSKAGEKLEKTMDELKHSNRELEQFAYVASHDLQEPLRMVASFTQLLEKQYKDKLDETAVEYINFAVDGAKRMQLLINDLLAYSRVTRKSTEFETVNLEKVLNEVLFNLEIVTEKNQTIIIRESLPEIQADYRQMVQLFQNLIGNALKYRRNATPEICISVQKEDDHWLFSVEDNGIGMESQYFEQVFQIFRRLHTQDEHEGTGIGLAITKRIIEHHGGRIWIESEPSKGSTFYFTIPINNKN